MKLMAPNYKKKNKRNENLKNKSVIVVDIKVCVSVYTEFQIVNFR